MTTKRLVIGAVLIIVIGGFGYYAISPLFRVLKANDPVPAGATAGAPMPGEASSTEMMGAAPAEVSGTFGHPASGTVRVVQAGGQTYVRYEDFKTINGPDIFVYLSADKNATDIVNLGPVKATSGNVNYLVPPGTDLAKYHYVLTWCRTFSVLFNSADLALH